MNKIEGQWALVTGASSGTGSDFARALAERGVNVVLAARRAESMEKLATELREKHKVQVHVEVIDLARAASGRDLYERLTKRGIAIEVLINNAGYGLHGEFVEQPLLSVLDMLQLNVMSVTELTHVFASDMTARGRGHILLVSSVTGYQATPTYAAYAASKAYVLLFGEALHTELARHNVTLTVLSPGLMDTGFLDAASHKPTSIMKRIMMKSRPVVDIGLRALFRARPSVVAGTMNKLTVFTTRLLSRPLQAKIAESMMKS